MRVVRLALRWKLLVAVAVSAPVAVLVTGALASPSRPAAGVTFQLVTAPTCATATRLGRACVDRPKIPEWTIADGSAQWNHTSGVGGLWQTSYGWKLPATVPPTGASLILALQAVEQTKIPSARICPAIIVSGGFTFKGASGEVRLGVCAEGGKTETPPAKTVTLLPPSAARGSLELTVRVQDGPIYTYTYRAVAAKKKKKKPLCRKPKGLDAEAVKCGELRFVFSQAGLRDKQNGLLDMTTSGVGHGDLTARATSEGVVVDNVVATLRRTVKYTTTDRHPRVVEGVLVFRASRSCCFEYNAEENPDDFRYLHKLDLKLVFSSYPKCSLPREGRDATLLLIDGHRSKYRDGIELDVDGCPEQAVELKDRSYLKPPLKPAVRVAISENY